MDSPALRIAQRFAFSAFAAAVLGELYVAGSGCHRKIATRVLDAFRVDDAFNSPCECGRCIPRSKIQSRESATSRRARVKRFNEETFRDGWRMRQRATAPTYKTMQSVGIGPGALWRLHRVEDMPHRLLPCEFFTTLISALMALQLTDRKDHKRDHLKEKRERARGVLATVHARWQPDGRGMVKLPPLVLPRTKNLYLPRSVRPTNTTMGAAGAEFLAMQSAPHVFKVGRDYRRAWSKAKNPKLDESVLFLLRVPTDDMGCFAFPAATLRWALDLASAVAASQALAMCDLRGERGVVDKATRRSVELFTPLWRMMWGAPIREVDPIPIAPAFLDGLFPSSPEHNPSLPEALRVLAAMQTLETGAQLAALVMTHHGVTSRELNKAWDVGLRSISVPALPNAGAGRRRRSVMAEMVESMVAEIASKEFEGAEQMDLNSSDAPVSESEARADAAVVQALQTWLADWRLPYLKRLQKMAEAMTPHFDIGASEPAGTALSAHDPLPSNAAAEQSRTSVAAQPLTH